MARAPLRRAMPRRKLIWARTVGTPTVSSLAPGASTVSDLLAGFRAANGGAMPLGTTVTRIRLDLAVQFTAAAPANPLTCGILVDQVQALFAEVPDPTEEPHADWMYWRTYWGPPPMDSAAAGVAGTVLAVYDIDVRAQRKMEELGETLYFSLRNGGATGTILANIAASVLLKLP